MKKGDSVLGRWIAKRLALIVEILPSLRSKSWETRQAAIEAVDAVCKAVGIWDSPATEIVNPPDFDTDAAKSVVPSFVHNLPRT